MGFTKTIIQAGNGQLPRTGQSVTVHCTGLGKDRDLTKKFWSTKDPGQEPFTFKVGLGQVIKVSGDTCITWMLSVTVVTSNGHSQSSLFLQGWDEGVAGMSIGEVAKIHCTPDYAYGAGGFPAWGIQPNSELIFEIEVLKIV